MQRQPMADHLWTCFALRIQWAAVNWMKLSGKGRWGGGAVHFVKAFLGEGVYFVKAFLGELCCTGAALVFQMPCWSGTMITWITMTVWACFLLPEANIGEQDLNFLCIHIRRWKHVESANKLPGNVNLARKRFLKAYLIALKPDNVQ